MPEEIKELLEKIHEEGIKAADAKALEIEKDAYFKAEKIIQKAQQQAMSLISDAQDKIKRMENSSQESLKQAGRDVVLTVRKQISETLEKILRKEISDRLSAQELTDIISKIIKEQASNDIVVTLSQHDKDNIAESFFVKLREELKKNIQVRHSVDIQSGFIISFDSGKSNFDFTDKAICEYMSLFLNPRLSEIIKI